MRRRPSGRPGRDAVAPGTGHIYVERFDVTVDQGSWLSSMSSTNNALRMVTVKNGAIYGDNDNGNLFIGDPVQDPSHTSLELAHWMDAPPPAEHGRPHRCQVLRRLRHDRQGEHRRPAH